MGYDQPDDPDMPPDEPPDRPARRPQPETRNLEEYYADLRAAVALEERTEPPGRSEPCPRSKPAGEQTEDDQQAQPGTDWEENAELSRWMWSEYKRRWPPEERAPVGNADDSQGPSKDSATVNDELEKECDHIAERERRTVSPMLREVESCDPNRHLIGFEFRMKGRDRIKEKAAKGIDENGLSPTEAIRSLPDAIRYTFQYDEIRYSDGVLADIIRMKEKGFELSILRNSWLADQYKGINSQWVEPESGQRFELQFHTRVSFEAKQITHAAYERLRVGQPDPFEHMVLEAFQARVAAAVPVPPGATEIPDYPQRDQNAR